MRPARAVLQAALAAAGAFALAADVQPGPRIVPILGKRFAYEPALVALRLGEPVVLELTTADRLHGFKAPSLGIREDMAPGETRRIALTPMTPGIHAFVCDVFCGDAHDDMSGAIKVE